MKTKLTYEWNDEDLYQEEQIRRRSNATGAYLTIFSIDEHLRSLLKQEHSEEVYECIEQIREKLYEKMESNHVDLNDLE